jgi:hypothetical protein
LKWLSSVIFELGSRVSGKWRDGIDSKSVWSDDSSDIGWGVINYQGLSTFSPKWQQIYHRTTTRHYELNIVLQFHTSAMLIDSQSHRVSRAHSPPSLSRFRSLNDRVFLQTLSWDLRLGFPIAPCKGNTHCIHFHDDKKHGEFLMVPLNLVMSCQSESGRNHRSGLKTPEENVGVSKLCRKSG